MPGSFQGLKVIDFSMGVAGPHAGMLCALHGADVIKVEPVDGDWGRRLGKEYGDLSAYATVFNRGKRSLAIDLKTDAGLRIVQLMVADADIIIEGFRPGVMRRFGMDYESVSKQNPNVVYVSVSGFGQTGARSALPATDSVAQGYSGFINLNRDSSGKPYKIDMIVIDVMTGLYAFQGISAAIIGRLRGISKGHYIDCSLLQVGLAFQAPKLMEHWVEENPRKLYVPLGVFPTLDGYINLSVNHNPDFTKFCRALGRQDLLADSRFATRDLRLANSDALLEQVEAELRKQKTAQWVEVFTAEGVLHAPIWSYEDVLKDDEIKRLEMVSWIQQDGFSQQLPLSNIPGAPVARSSAREQAPHTGQHTKEVLGEFNVAPDQIETLLADKTIAQYGAES